MAGFLYYLSGRNNLPVREIAQLGLDHALDRKFESNPVTMGPDGKPGLVLAATGSVPALGYWPESQTWAVGPGKSWWLGTINEHEPKPADLARRQMLDSEGLVLADGRSWLVPIARRFTEPRPDAWDAPFRFAINLPELIDLNDAGEWRIGSVVDQYRPLWSLACDWAALRQGDAGEELAERLNGRGRASAAVQVLAVNYRLGPCEVARLKLLTREHCEQILDYLIDQPSYELLVKKKLARLVSASTSPGATASTPATPPPSPT